MTFWYHNNIILFLVVSVLIINWWLYQVPIWIKPLDYLTVDRIILVFQRSLWPGVFNKFACYESPPLHFFSYYISPMPIWACMDNRGSVFMLHEPEVPEGRGLFSTIQQPSSRNGYYYSSIQKNRQVIESHLKVILDSKIICGSGWEDGCVMARVQTLPPQNPHKAWYSSPYLQSQHLCGLGRQKWENSRNSRYRKPGMHSSKLHSVSHKVDDEDWHPRLFSDRHTCAVAHVYWCTYTYTHTFLMK